MRAVRAIAALLGLVLVQCNRAPVADPWPAHASAIIDSIRHSLAAYQDRFSATDRDSLQRFYAEDRNWKWAANGRFRLLSSLMIRSRLDRLAVYPHWFIGYNDPVIQPLAPGLAVVQTEYRLSFEAANGKRSAYDGALTIFWKHLPEGWKIVGGHSSSVSDSMP